MDIITNTQNNSKLNYRNLDELLSNLKNSVEQSAKQGLPTHEVEKTIFEKIMKIGAQMLGHFFSLQGNGDVGASVQVESGHIYRRLSPRTRGYQSIFGYYKLTRAVYGTYESKKIEVVPLDTRLQLPQQEHSYLLQEWGQMMATEVPFKKTLEMLGEMFPISLSVDTLEHTNRLFAEHAANHREESTQTITESLEHLTSQELDTLNASILTLSADGKGIPIKRRGDAARVEGFQKNKGPKPDRKRMAVIGASYVVAPYVRTPEEVLEALFKEGAANDSPSQEPQRRPTPIYKSVIGNLTRTIEEEPVSATTLTGNWLREQRACFEDSIQTPPVFLMDGQVSLWNEIERQLPEEERIEILDLLHAISYLWDIAHLFFDSNDSEIVPFMKTRVLRLLKGEIKNVISGVRQMATKRGFSKAQSDKLEAACSYLENNQHRMRYHEYLEQGLPIASGVIEGACRHFVKDRMERAGMQWTLEGAQAMLDVRAIKLNGHWEEFVAYRVKQEIAKNYPHKNIIDQVEWPIAA